MFWTFTYKSFGVLTLLLLYIVTNISLQLWMGFSRFTWIVWLKGKHETAFQIHKGVVLDIYRATLSSSMDWTRIKCWMKPFISLKKCISKMLSVMDIYIYRCHLLAIEKFYDDLMDNLLYLRLIWLILQHRIF